MNVRPADLLWLLLAVSSLACGNPERRAREEFARDLAQHKYPRTGLTLANVVQGGIHDLWTDTVCETHVTRRGSGRSLGSSHTTCRTSRLGFNDGAGNDFVFHVAVHSATRPYYLVPLTQAAMEAMEKVTGLVPTASALSDYLAYDAWLSEVVPRWKSFALSIRPAWSSPDSSVEATVQLVAEGGRPLASIRSRFKADVAEADLADHPLARPYYELREVQFAFPDEGFFERRGADVIAGALAPHARGIDWKREAANVETRSLEMIERCKRYRPMRCADRVEMLTIESWPDLEIEQSSGELRVTVLDRFESEIRVAVPAPRRPGSRSRP